MTVSFLSSISFVPAEGSLGNFSYSAAKHEEEMPKLEAKLSASIVGYRLKEAIALLADSESRSNWDSRSSAILYGFKLQKSVRRNE